MLSPCFPFAEIYTMENGIRAITDNKRGGLFLEGKYTVYEEVSDEAGNYDWNTFEIIVRPGNNESNKNNK